MIESDLDNWKYSIITVNFPFADNPLENKSRPVLCLTEPAGNYNEIIVAFITSKIPFQKLATDVILDKQTGNSQTASLPHTSTIRLHKLLTINAELAIGSLGKISRNYQKQIEQNLRNLFNL